MLSQISIGQKRVKTLIQVIVGYFCLLMTANVAVCQNTDTVRVATKNFPPFAFEQNGQYVGFSIDLWKEIAQELDC